GRAAQHEDVRARAEDAFLQARDDDRMDFRVFEAQALNRIGELDIDAEVVRIQLEPVVGGNAAVLLDIHGEDRDRAVEIKFPVMITIRRGLKCDPRVGRNSSVHHVKRTCAVEDLSKRGSTSSRRTDHEQRGRVNVGSETAELRAWTADEMRSVVRKTLAASTRPRSPTRIPRSSPVPGWHWTTSSLPAPRDDSESAYAASRSRRAQPRAAPSSPPPAERASGSG